MGFEVTYITDETCPWKSIRVMKVKDEKELNHFIVNLDREGWTVERRKNLQSARIQARMLSEEPSCLSHYVLNFDDEFYVVHCSGRELGLHPKSKGEWEDHFGSNRDRDDILRLRNHRRGYNFYREGWSIAEDGSYSYSS